MERIDPATGALPVLDLEGTPRPLASLWEARPAVLVFVRHFG